MRHFFVVEKRLHFTRFAQAQHHHDHHLGCGYIENVFLVRINVFGLGMFFIIICLR